MEVMNEKSGVTSASEQTAPMHRRKSLAEQVEEGRHSASKDVQRAMLHASISDADEALKALDEMGDDVEIDEATNKRLLRKIDINILPLLCVIYGIQFLDKTTISYASIMGLRQDLNLVGDNYQWLGSMFYFGYLVWEYPTNRLLQTLPLAKYSSFNIILWGLVLCCFAACKNFAGALAIRFFLGVFEAAVTPGFALFTSQWYTIHEQGVRTAIWFSFNGFAQIFGGVVAFGIAKGTRLHGSSIEPWKIVFLFTGLLTIAVGFLFLWFMPDNPMNARFLKPADRVLAIERIRKNQQGVGNKHFKMYQLKQTLTDPITWAFAAYSLLSNIPNGGLTNFFNQIITSFGYTAEQSLLYGTGIGAVQVVALPIIGYFGDRFRNRLLISTAGLLISMLGMLLIIALPLENKIGRLLGVYVTAASPTPFVALLSLISSNFAGYTRKTTVAAIYLIFYCVGNIVGPQTFRPEDAPRYVPAEITMIVCWGCCLIDIVLIWWVYRRRNQQKEAARQAPGYQKVHNQEFLDLTDLDNTEFVYSL